MTSNSPNEFDQDEEEDLCSGCTRSDCTGCPNQPITDKLLGINALAGFKDDLITTVENRLKARVDEANDDDDEDDEEQYPDVLDLKPLEALASSHRTPEPKPPADSLPPKRGKGRPKKEVDPSIPKRRPGAPQGNHNAVKHGLYISGCSIHNITPLERAQAMDFLEIINNFKDYMKITYQNGLTAKSIEEVNGTMQTLSVAVMALNRLIHMHHEFDTSFSSRDFKITSKTTASQLTEYYQKKCAAFMDLSDLQPSSNS